MNEGLRLREAARETERDFALHKGNHFDGDCRTERVVDRKQRTAAVEVTRRHGVVVLSKEWFDALLQRTGNVQPAELMNRRIETGVWRQLQILRVLARIFKAELILKKVRILSLRHDLDRKSGEVLGFGFRQVEREQRLRVSAIRFHGHAVVRCLSGFFRGHWGSS